MFDLLKEYIFCLFCLRNTAELGKLKRNTNVEVNQLNFHFHSVED